MVRSLQSPTRAASPARTDSWTALREHTPARIALGRAGVSLPCAEVLRFGLAHAQARDAVHCALDAQALQRGLEAEGFPVLQAHSQAADRRTYLLRPDLGRRLREDCRTQLERAPRAAQIAFVIADGLSAAAAQRHALPVLRLLRQQFDTDWEHTPVVVAQQGRVALGDDIGAALGARLVVVMLGERPGLSSPDSLGIYLTFAPRPGRMDSERNCISNVRPQGQQYAEAAHRLAFLMKEALRLQLSGVRLKDDSGLASIASSSAQDEDDHA